MLVSLVSVVSIVLWWSVCVTCGVGARRVLSGAIPILHHAFVKRGQPRLCWYECGGFWLRYRLVVSLVYAVSVVLWWSGCVIWDVEFGWGDLEFVSEVEYGDLE